MSDFSSSPRPSILDGGLGSPFVSMGEDEATLLARTQFGIQGRLTRLATEKDDTFRLDSDGGKSYIFKIANPAEDDAEIEFQTLLLLHIEREAPSIPVPRVVPGLDGELTVLVTDRAGQKRRLRLLTFLAGTVLEHTTTTGLERYRIGEILARLRLATASFSHPADNRVLAWDVKNLPSLRPLLDCNEDSYLRDRIALGLDRFECLTQAIAGLRQQVLHNDFNRSNIVVNHDRPEFVTGVIDFGDTVRTAVAIDVSTALLNQLIRGVSDPAADLFADGRDLLKGYLSIADLSDEELEIIPHLVMGRVLTRALLSVWLAKATPWKATYLLRNTQPGWAQLEWFLAKTPDQVSGLLRRSRLDL